ncbi:MAG: hypothetical protein FWE03_03095 [Firmicutes bacterium]|nr:hypothetical protein [Bacillota bacterium]
MQLRKNVQITTSEYLVNCLSNDNIFNQEGIVGIEYPIELNAFIIVMDCGEKYLVEVTRYNDD